MEETAVTTAGMLTEAGEFLSSGIGVVWDLMTANPILTLFIGASLVTLAIGFFKKIKGVAKH